MKKSFILLIGLMLSVAVSAQEVVSSAGGYSEAGDISVSWTLGELAIQTLSAGDIVLTQGFQQVFFEVTSIDDIPFEEFQFNVFPNPTPDYINIKSLNTERRDVVIELFDMQGKRLSVQKMEGTSNLMEMKMSEFPSGQYILRIVDKTGKPIQSFKVVKK